MLGTLAFISCGREGITIGEKGYTVSGKVTDSALGLSIESVLISFGDSLIPKLDIFTDSIGEYSIIVPQNGRIIYARKEGYKTKGKEIIGINSDIIGFDFILQTE